MIYHHSFLGARNDPITIAWSFSYGSNDSYSSGVNPSSFNTYTSLSNTTAGALVESIQFALIEMTKCPPFFKKYLQFKLNIRL